LAVCAKAWIWTDRGRPLQQLDDLYEYMMKRLTEANIKTDPKIIDEVAAC
jgi:flagellin-specific chaperone FliS